jgi:hypothetical protein
LGREFKIRFTIAGAADRDEYRQGAGVGETNTIGFAVRDLSVICAHKEPKQGQGLFEHDEFPYHHF